MRNDLQKNCEIVEELIQRTTKTREILTDEEFLALNRLLLEMAIEGKYTVPDKYIR